MKYLSLILLVFFLKISWAYTQRTPALSQQDHVSIQAGLRELISGYILKQLPDAKGLKFHNIWTENVVGSKGKKVKANFVYSFSDENKEVGKARVQISGYAYLTKAQEGDAEVDYWNFAELFILNNEIEYHDAVIIKPGQ